MRSEWREVELSNMCSYRQERIEVDRLTTSNYISTANMLPDKGGIEVAENLPNTPTTSRFYAGDVLVSNIRPYFKKAWLAAIDGGCSNDVLVMKANEDVDQGYLYYLLSSDHFFAHMTATSKGTKMPRGDKKAIMMYKTQNPPFNTQKAIADTLSCLDAKIEVNNRIIKNLEEQAQAIFKSWFIDFEPFQEGEFVESELGMIPEGWKAGTIADLGEVVGGSTPSKKFTEYFSENGIAWITPKDLSLNKNKFVSKGQIDITQLGLKNSSARVMPKGTVLFSSRAPIGYIAIAKNEVTTNQGFKSVVPREDVGTEYVYHFLKNSVSTIEAVAGGSTFKEVSSTTMKQIPALIPSKSVLEEFKKAIRSHFQLQELLEEQNTTLATLRDTLLPKLMSGEIEVPIDQ